VSEIEAPREAVQAATATIEAHLNTLDGRPWQIDRDAVPMLHCGMSALENFLPAEMCRRLRSSSTPILVIRKATPIERLPDTPATGFVDDTLLARYDTVLLGLCGLLGIEPIAYAFENEGRLARNVVPNPACIDAESSWGFGKALSWHQDNNFQPFELSGSHSFRIPPMPRFLVFLGLRNLERVATRLLPTACVLSRLSEADRVALSASAFSIAPPESARVHAPFRKGGVALLARHGEDIISRFDASDGVIGHTPGAREALVKLRVAIDAATDDAVDVLLQPGDVLIFDNYRTLHRRDSFTPHSAAEGRWLRRLYGRKSHPRPGVLQ
jgi:hypothetical protein